MARWRVGIAEAFEGDRRPAGELDHQPQAAAHGLDIAAQGREQEIAALLQLGDRRLADAERFGQLRLGQLPRLADVLERQVLGMQPVGLRLDARPALRRQLRHLIPECRCHLIPSFREVTVEPLIRLRDEPPVEPPLASARLIPRGQEPLSAGSKAKATRQTPPPAVQRSSFMFAGRRRAAFQLWTFALEQDDPREDYVLHLSGSASNSASKASKNATLHAITQYRLRSI